MSDTKEHGMPQWPERILYFYSSGAPTSSVSATEYERARADAAIARLRVAVDALKAVRAESRSNDAMWFEGVYDKLADEALALIGELPQENERE